MRTLRNAVSPTGTEDNAVWKNMDGQLLIKKITEKNRTLNEEGQDFSGQFNSLKCLISSRTQ